jgi:hypothetical protein
MDEKSRGKFTLTGCIRGRWFCSEMCCNMMKYEIGLPTMEHHIYEDMLSRVYKANPKTRSWNITESNIYAEEENDYFAPKDY